VIPGLEQAVGVEAEMIANAQLNRCFFIAGDGNDADGQGARQAQFPIIQKR
jgi:hypothetical protein